MEIFLRLLIASVVGISSGAVVVFALEKIFAFLDKDSDTDAASSSSSLPFKLKVGDTTYGGSLVNNVGMAVLDVDTASIIDLGYGMAKSDGTFMVVTVAIENQQSHKIAMCPSFFKLVDQGGNVYPASSNSTTHSGRINSGRTKIDAVAFDVPSVIAKQPLTLRFQSGRTEAISELPLMVQSVQKTARKLSAAPNFAASSSVMAKA